MFEGLFDQFRPAMHKCEVWSHAVLSRLVAIETAIVDSGADPLDRRSFPRLSGSGVYVGADPFLTVPLGQVWIIENVTLNCVTGGGGRVVLSQQPNMVLPVFAGHLDNAGSTGARGNTWTPNAVVLPQTPIYVTITDNVGNPFDLYVQCRQIDIPTRPEPSGINPGRAHTGSGAPEGMTSAQGPPIHERSRDQLPLRAA